MTSLNECVIVLERQKYKPIMKLTLCCDRGDGLLLARKCKWLWLLHTIDRDALSTFVYVRVKYKLFQTWPARARIRSSSEGPTPLHVLLKMKRILWHVECSGISHITFCKERIKTKKRTLPSPHMYFVNVFRVPQNVQDIKLVRSLHGTT